MFENVFLHRLDELLINFEELTWEWRVDVASLVVARDLRARNGEIFESKWKNTPFTHTSFEVFGLQKTVTRQGTCKLSDVTSVQVSCL